MAYKLKFTPKEAEAFEAFKDAHHECMVERGTTDVNLLLRGTGIGTVVYVKCKHCGKKCNITDYDSW